MRLKPCFLALLLSLFPLSIEASTLSAIQCSPLGEGKQACELKIEGAVEAGERLYLPIPQETDKLFFGDKLLASGGYFLNQPFAAPFLPRVYPLEAVEGIQSPVLRLETQSYFGPASSAFPRARVIPSTYPLRKTYLPFFLRAIGFALLFGLSLFVVFFIRRTTIDGWIYPAEEIRWLFGSLCSFLILRSEFSHALVPGLWSADFHLTSTKICFSLSLWCLSSLLLHVRFNDRSCVERGIYKRPPASYRTYSGIALVAALGALLPPMRASYLWITAIYALPLALNLYASIQALEWKRVLKRSDSSPLFFHLSLIALSGLVIIFPLIQLLSLTASVLVGSAWAVLLFGAWRMQRYFKAKKRGHELALECRSLLLDLAQADRRLQALCEFIEEEWAAARVSIIAVEHELGLVISSAGPEAIPETQLSRSRKLGPFLRRVCREGHILYAPVAEELGRDLQNQGLKHSSLAIPLKQQGRVRAVLCMMADEGERIPPLEATVLELLTNDLSLEILSAVAQHVAEKRCEHLMAIAQEADGVAVEHLDNWGHLHYSEKEERRYLVGAKPETVATLTACFALKKAQGEFNRELKAVWHALALAFEFVPKEIKEDFWVLSPKEFRHPYLRSLGAEKVSLLLAQALDRHARALAAKESFLLLAQPATKIAAGAVKLNLVSYGTQEKSAYEIDALDFERLRTVRDRAGHSGPLMLGPVAESAGLLAHVVPLGENEEISYFSVLSVAAEKKEIRKIETKALDAARDSLRRVA